MEATRLEHNELTGKLVTITRYANNVIEELLTDFRIKEPLSNELVSRKVCAISDAFHNLEGLGGAMLCNQPNRVAAIASNMLETLDCDYLSLQTVLPTHKFPIKHARMIFSDIVRVYSSESVHYGPYEESLGMLIQGIGLGFVRIRYNTVYNGSMLSNPDASKRALAACKAMEPILDLGVAIERGHPTVIAQNAMKLRENCTKTYPAYRRVAKDPLYLEVLLKAVSMLSKMDA